MKATIQRLRQIANSRLIIPLVLPFLVLLFFCTTAAGSSVPLLVKKRLELKLDGKFENIRLYGQFSVVLTNEPAGTIVIVGKQKDLKRIKHSLNSNTLTIDVSRLFSFSKLTIYVSALSLQNIQLTGDADVSSVEFIRSHHLHLFMNGNIKVRVKTMGKLSVESPEDIELLWRPPGRS